LEEELTQLLAINLNQFEWSNKYYEIKVSP
jgi:hypothetical protein